MAPRTLNPKELNQLNPREMKAWRSYIIASRRLLDALDSDLSCHDLSMADYEVLSLLNDAPERRMRMTELADLAMVSKSRLSHRMKVMEKWGWVKRMACSQDKRGSWAVMTDKGIRAVSKAAPDHVNSVRNLLIDHLTVKDQEDISKIFDRITTKLRSQFRAEDN